ncbi:PolC-type DNA polymerase III domain-containing protein [Paraburkholderia caledonica]|uniref:DNA polymerase III epsilon subunit-like protein n=1 Tax=Paraburkholderia caledonica TaxID=134536 RepID=A0AB73IFC9_9BURK|nr:DNA polymerase III epsilon subunit-like protein [Paraburkholderia caledonica]
MLLFLDTEHTGFAHSRPKLISIGIVSEDGQREFYVELEDTWKVGDCSDFVKREVLPLLDGRPIPLSTARQNLINWLADAPRSVQPACDSVIDFNFLLWLLGDVRPYNLRPTYYDLAPLIVSPTYHRTVLSYYDASNREHHALADARAYRTGWLAWMDARKAKGTP